MMLNRLVLLRRTPPLHLLLTVLALRVFRPDGQTPRQLVVDLYEVIIAQDGLRGLDSSEEVHHAFFELGFETGDVAGGVNLRERHAEFVLQAPEASEEDGAREEIVLTVGTFEHDGQIVLNETAASGHRVFGERWLDGEGLVGEEVAYGGWGASIEAWVALREIVRSERSKRIRECGKGAIGRSSGRGNVQFLQKLNSAVVGFRRCPTAFLAAFCDALRLQGVELRELIVKLNPVIPMHRAQAHSYVVGTILDWSIR